MIRRNFRRTENIVRYWAARALVLCRKIDHDEPSEAEPGVLDALALLDAPRRIMVIGESGCGKSSLIAGLLGFACVAAHKFDGPYIRWRLECDDGNASSSRFLPTRQLERLEIVDTAGSENALTTEALPPLLSSADIVIAVFGGDNPWSPSTWELLSVLPEDSRAVRIVALTHCDRRPPEDVMGIKAQLRELSAKHLGIELPLYQVSPGGHVQGSGLDVFSTRIQDTLDSPELLRADIRALYTATVKLMDEQASILRRRDQMLRTDSGFLTSIDREIDGFQHRQAESIPAQVQALGHIAHALVPQLAELVLANMGAVVTPGRVLHMERMGEWVDEHYYELVRAEVEKRQEAQDRTFLFACRENWDQVRPRMKQKLGSDIGDFPEKTLGADLLILRKELGRLIYKPLNKMGIKNFIAGLGKEQAAWMERIIYLVLIFVIIGGVIGTLGHNYMGLISLGAAVAIWLTGCGILQWEKSRLRRRIAEFAAPLQLLVVGYLEEPLRQLLVSRVSAYRKLYTKPRLKVARNAEQLAPLLKEHGEIYRALRSLGHYL